MRIKKNYLVSLICLTPILTYGLDYSMVMLVKGNYKLEESKIISGTEEITDDLTTVYEEASGNLDNVCEVKFTNIRKKSTSGFGGALTSIYIKSNGKKIDEGNLISESRTLATFDNLKVSSNTTYPNSNYYYVRYALKGHKGHPESMNSAYNYWLAQTWPATYTITFNEPQSVSSVVWSDAITSYCRDGDRAPALGYNLEIYECSGDLAYSKTIDKQYNNACDNLDDQYDEIEIKFIK